MCSLKPTEETQEDKPLWGSRRHAHVIRRTCTATSKLAIGSLVKDNPPPPPWRAISEKKNRTDGKGVLFSSMLPGSREERGEVLPVRGSACALGMDNSFLPMRGLVIWCHENYSGVAQLHTQQWQCDTVLSASRSTPSHPSQTLLSLPVFMEANKRNDKPSPL
ncbi:hypothetical protein B296_00020138 [Ensete ventricosum]|uniref:Uncharacterized protein n=1 Tax=Ensete ventricosum TaxID=4639 RepID=A0A426YQG4_ENSVE|nr:hypothetical protein B296_00020138 [Ensete ventricosum]